MYSRATLLKEDLPLPLAQKKVFFILALARCLDIQCFGRIYYYLQYVLTSKVLSFSWLETYNP